MSDDDVDLPPPRKPIPLIIWIALAIVVVVAFMALARALNPVGISFGRAQAEVAAPGGPPPAERPGS